MALSRARCLCTRLIPKHYTVPIRTTTALRRSVRNMFGKYLFYTNTVCSGVLMGVGDLIQQEIEYQRKIIPHRYEWDRTARMFLVGLIIGAPQHWFYVLLDKRLPGNSVSVVIKKIFLDQLIASPGCIFLFFVMMDLLEGRKMDQCIEELKKKFMTVIIVDWMVWPPSQFFNFYFLDPKYRVMYINVLTMIYNIFLSYIKHVDYHHEKSQ